MFLWENRKVNNFCGASVNLLIQGDSVAAPFLLLRNPEKDNLAKLLMRVCGSERLLLIQVDDASNSIEVQSLDISAGVNIKVIKLTIIVRTPSGIFQT